MHPDKTACFGAEAAFKLIGQAVFELSQTSTSAYEVSSEDEVNNSAWNDVFCEDFGTASTPTADTDSNQVQFIRIPIVLKPIVI